MAEKTRNTPPGTEKTKPVLLYNTCVIVSTKHNLLSPGEHTCLLVFLLSAFPDLTKNGHRQQKARPQRNDSVCCFAWVQTTLSSRCFQLRDETEKWEAEMEQPSARTRESSCLSAPSDTFNDPTTSWTSLFFTLPTTTSSIIRWNYVKLQWIIIPDS